MLLTENKVFGEEIRHLDEDLYKEKVAKGEMHETFKRLQRRF